MEASRRTLPEETYAAVRLKARRPPRRPFFLYLSHISPHWPLQAKAADIAKHEGRYRLRWDALRQARLDKQIRLEIVPAGTQLRLRNRGRGDWYRTFLCQRGIGVGHVVDLMPTILQATGTRYPQTLNEHEVLPLEWISLLPAFAGETVPERWLFWEQAGTGHNPWEASRDG